MWVASVALSLTAGSCSANPTELAATTVPTPTTADETPGGNGTESDAAEVLRSFATDTRGGLSASFAAIEAQIRTSASAVRDAAIPLVGAAEPSVRFAAIYALSLTGDNAAAREALGPVLESPDISERLLAAEALMRGGDESALPAVIDALGSDRSMDLWEPPKPVWRFARLLLLGATGLDFGLRSADTVDAARATQAAWQEWWRTNGSTYELPAPGPP